MTTVKLPTLKELETAESAFSQGHRLCAGCAEGAIVRMVLDAARFAEPDGKPNINDPYPVIAGLATGCLEVASTPYPYTSWNLPMYHSLFENVSAVTFGVTAAYEALRNKGMITSKKNYRFVDFGGDGATYDIGLQSLSNALINRTPFLYCCLNNFAYENTGIQLSSATPYGAWTTTSNAGKAVWRKDLTAIVAAHNIPYVAQAAPYTTKPRDLYDKVGKAFASGGPAFINIYSPCARGSRFPESKTMEVARLAVETCFWPLYEIIEGKWSCFRPKNKRPVADYLSTQGSFKHLMSDKEKLEYIQKRVDAEWETLLAKCGS